MIKLPKDYVDDILVRLTHHSSALENNRITLNETVSIILHNTIPGKVSVREFYEVDNHKRAFQYMMEQLDEELSLSLIHGIHEQLMDRLHHERGRFKSSDNAIAGADFETAPYQETPMLMVQWVDNLKYRLDTAEDEDSIILAVCESHIEFERIHPYADGNGRTGRLIMVYLLLKYGLCPLIINKEDKEKYIHFLSTRDVDGFASYAKSIIEKERVRYLKFLNNKPIN
jgi:Fic family protein